ncbi:MULTISPECIES: hypothetical protein [unclassified Rhodococcus (in: high G+C Gram-positive bacteria)]|jgi:hypothetical protein|uniref:hypothetical protein n=1 Tax=unclassified Rhodococcus (in: high G+C Gram-positive bacteria) TaxID=192944 RepID=UPI000377F8BF
MNHEFMLFTTGIPSKVTNEALRKPKTGIRAAARDRVYYPVGGLALNVAMP